MIITVLSGQRVYVYEAVLLVLGYGGYILFMCYNQSILGKFPNRLMDEDVSVEEAYSLNGWHLMEGNWKKGRDDPAAVNTNPKMEFSYVVRKRTSVNSAPHEAMRTTKVQLFQPPPEILSNVAMNEMPANGDVVGDGDESRFAWPEGLGGQLFFVGSFPFLVAFTITIPDVSQKKWENWSVYRIELSVLV